MANITKNNPSLAENRAVRDNQAGQVVHQRGEGGGGGDGLLRGGHSGRGHVGRQRPRGHVLVGGGGGGVGLRGRRDRVLARHAGAHAARHQHAFQHHQQLLLDRSGEFPLKQHIPV